MKKHANLSIFIPNEGCEHRCAFCDQRAVSGETNAPSARDVRRVCGEYLPKNSGDSRTEIKATEIAFFGGSFTAVPRDYMISLLEAAYPFVKEGRAAGIRVSTRPDAVDGKTLGILKAYGVTSVELGAQSTDDGVLLCNGRGHSSGDIRKAARLINENGFSLGLQMMIGMYGERDSLCSAVNTARDFIEMNPETARIYPAVVLKNTRWEKLYRDGGYTPISLKEAVGITAKLLRMFEGSGIRVIRAGLHAEASLAENIVAGPYHPAFGELARAEVYRELIEKRLRGRGPGDYTVRVARGRAGAAAGISGGNSKYFAGRGFTLKIKEDEELAGFGVNIVVRETKKRTGIF